MTLNNWITLLGGFTIVIPGLDMIYNKKLRFWGVGLIIVGTILTLLSFIKNSDDTDYQKKMTTTVDSLEKRADSILTNQKVERERNEKFQVALFKEFRITRDSLTNRPVQQTFNTNIENANHVDIGGH